MAARPHQPDRDRDGSEKAYRVILEEDASDGGFVVRIPAFPHAHTQGDTVEDALANVREIIELEIEVAAERGEDIPPPDADVPVRVERVVIAPPAA
ncbi:MAG TPA: type II toxin-antitoxin system HicB family antitoxin [Candidatus Elarobacter sp.]|nr:type II toxin-antitoxin system HicB family antitoxin [Candidatus Elarobacter sp.]